MTTLENSTNPLFDNLVPATPATRSSTRLSFADAMPRMGMRSVFDIIRQPKQAFTRQLRTLSDADGEMAYENAMCYATQIARSFRDDVVSSGRSIAQTSQRSGVRALVDIGPSYPNLFRENWDEFCKVGAIEAMDGPVAYLGSLRRFAEREIEDNADGQTNITLAIRRPDLDALVIDERSTYQPVPMLDLVNDVLTQGIDKYQKEKNDVRPIHTLLAEKKHPFVFPYHFAHQQVSLALGGDKPGLGQLNYRLSVTPGGKDCAYGEILQPAANALLSMTGVNPSLQKLLLAPTLFSHFYVGVATLLGNKWFHATDTESMRPQPHYSTGFLLAPQDGLESALPPATNLAWADATGTTVARLVSDSHSGLPTKTLSLSLSSLPGPSGSARPMHNTVYNAGSIYKTLRIGYQGSESDLEEAAGRCWELSVDARTWGDIEDFRPSHRHAAQWRMTFTADHDYTLRPEECAFFAAHYGIEFTHASLNPLTALETFLQATDLNSEQIEALLAVKTCAPIKSAHFIPSSRGALGGQGVKPYPQPNHYGAGYVNGVGGSDPGTRDYDFRANAMDLVQDAGTRKWHLTNTSLERFDRLQRMIRLHKSTGLSYADLDTLLVSAMRSEGDANAGMELNTNSMRVLGTFRYFSQHYQINAQEFAAFVYHLTPCATVGQVPLLDKVFNTSVLFDQPLVIDNVAFSLSSGDPTEQRTVAQICASLRVQPGEELERMAADTLTAVTPLKRSLAVLSSFYRQARIAQMFGLSVTDCWELTDLLGGSAYRSLIASGRLKALDAAGKDVLDVLMELDWAVNWLKANKLNVSQLRALLINSPEAVTQQLLDRLQQLSTDAHAQRVTPASIKALALPVTDQAGRLIDWVAKLQPSAVLDANGLVPECTLTLVDTTQEQLQQAVTTLIGDLDLHDEVRAHATDMLADFLVNAATAQARLSEACLQELTGLLPELALLAARSTALTPHGLLLAALQAWPNGQPVEANITALGQQIGKVLLMAQTLKWSHTGARALRTFVVKPSWLGSVGLWPQSLHSLHLLKSYDTLFNTLGQPEERLLDYLEQANTSVSKRPGKRQLALQSQACNADLASLLGWSETEVAVLTALLPQGIAKTVAHVDWLRRAQALALETGLSTATLVQACALTADSPEADWQAVGQAAIAAAI
ncbi:Tc toxin subunit A [Pseudomonas sp. UBA4194]|uniref:Tc toxin subunit A n=1 Tax=Pseudomonas sp. UBA4194 TaxID=1947317 RepID=UPI0025F669AD|nr:Tc toxin subunit A [Pseudomonas sp. UBA4194]